MGPSVFCCTLRTLFCWEALWGHTGGSLESGSDPGYQAMRELERSGKRLCTNYRGALASGGETPCGVSFGVFGVFFFNFC